jgi:prepilin-type N-terminal cleavage/methylation domain-containing protein
MQMLEYYPRTDKNQQKGFTLLELLIVLTLLAGIVSISAPNMITLYDRASFSFQRDEVLRQIIELPYEASRQGQKFILVAPQAVAAPRLESGKAVTLDLPQGWSLRTNKTIHYNPDGFCSGGEITIIYEQEEVRYFLDSPYCFPRLS